ncbi:uncharacterized protein LOC106179816 [Lingula anatina]|uniref:Uncharacterized protein LOC106179816 n=1 Tax=Lingula anatina TaxID=7574 RepID=A0A1S3K8T5_LINAN|nr:uncharacterized protein LOC106179816 [Lingula anatina]|eukprot:XP_013419038.1 uncharacterized protein LOC106179816 [Lingula anatina]
MKSFLVIVELLVYSLLFSSCYVQGGDRYRRRMGWGKRSEPQVSDISYLLSAVDSLSQNPPGNNGDDMDRPNRGWGKRFSGSDMASTMDKRGWGKRSTTLDLEEVKRAMGWGKRSFFNESPVRRAMGWGKRERAPAGWGKRNQILVPELKKGLGWGKRILKSDDVADVEDAPQMDYNRRFLPGNSSASATDLSSPVSNKESTDIRDKSAQCQNNIEAFSRMLDMFVKILTYESCDLEREVISKMLAQVRMSLLID